MSSEGNSVVTYCIRKKFIVPDKERPGDRKSHQVDVFDENGDTKAATAGPRRKKAA